jgi:hypothetical protein
MRSKMKQYCYIIAERIGGERGVVSFRHTFVNARDEFKAYTVGAAILPEPPEGTGLNDYVVEVPEREPSLTKLERYLESLVLDRLHPIAYPGEYGLGNEHKSYADDPEGALTVVVEVVDLMMEAFAKAHKMDEQRREEADVNEG